MINFKRSFWKGASNVFKDKWTSLIKVKKEALNPSHGTITLNDKKELTVDDPINMFVEQVVKNSKNRYKDFEVMPEELLNRLVKVLENRTSQQLKNLKKKMKRNEESHVPESLYLPVGWTMKKQNVFTQKSYGPSETFLYISTSMPVHFSSLRKILIEYAERNPSFKPTSMLDFGSGPGTGSWAAKDCFGDSLKEYRLVEPSQSMIDASMIILEDFPGLSVRKSLLEMKKDIVRGNKYDMIIVNYVLSDIPNDFQKVAIISSLWELLQENGALVLVDQGNPWGSFNVRSARKMLLDSAETANQVHIAAPCTHNFDCPMETGEFCHFVQRNPKATLPNPLMNGQLGGSIRTKYSYVIIEKKQQEDKNINNEWGRLIRGAILCDKHTLMDICHPKGKLERVAVTKRKLDGPFRPIYRASRKCHWGALWPTSEHIDWLKEKAE